MEVKKYVDVLTQHATDHHRPHEFALVDFMDYLIKCFRCEEFLKGSAEDIKAHWQTMQDEDSVFYELAVCWTLDVLKAMDRGEYLDLFGLLYESLYLTRSKASHTGQFFTPGSISTLCAEILDDDRERGTVSDCAVGSGRLLLVHYMKVTKTDYSRGRRFKYEGQDSDIIACKMCALNLMVHGMNGTVICRDTLANSTPTVIYHINEVRYPIPTMYYSIRAELPQTTKK